MSSTMDEILNNEVPVGSETSGDDALVLSAPPQLRVLTFNGPDRQHLQFLWLFVPLVLVLVAVI